MRPVVKASRAVDHDLARSIANSLNVPDMPTTQRAVAVTTLLMSAEIAGRRGQFNQLGLLFASDVSTLSVDHCGNLRIMACRLR